MSHPGWQVISQGRGGCIIGACSGSGKQGFVSLSAYSSSKFGIRGLTLCAALELGAHGITVNAYPPGPVKTPLWDGIVATAGAGVEDHFTKGTALGHIGLPTDVAALVSCLASKEFHLIMGQTTEAGTSIKSTAPLHNGAMEGQDY